MTKIAEVYERYKHVDWLLSDKAWLPEGPFGCVLYDLWQAVKEQNHEQENPDNT